MTKLLNIDANAKTVKGQARGFMTAVLYLAPYKASGFNVCPMAEMAGCAAACLNTAGRGGIAKRGAVISTDAGDIPDNAIQRARIRRTRLFVEDRAAFMAQLVREIEAFIRKADRKGLTPTVRLNGTSDILWERIECERDGETFAHVFAAFPDVQFYDYTKIAKRFRNVLPANYHLSLSYSESSTRYQKLCRDASVEVGAPLVLVYRTKAAKAKAMANAEAVNSGRIVDGDETDLRFTDPKGAWVYLYAKGRARHDQTGFVLDAS